MADLFVELVTTGVADGLAALAADLLVERVAALVADLLTALAAGFADGHAALVFFSSAIDLSPRFASYSLFSDFSVARLAASDQIRTF